MNIGVGLPTSTSGISGQLLVDWAKRADAGPFSSVGVVDRVAYQNYEPFTALAAAAAVTQRVRLATMVVIAPLRNTAILAKQAASVHALSDGRFTLGLAVGARGEDYAVSGIDSRGRGRRFGEQLEAIRDIWEEGKIGPTPTTAGPQLLVAGAAAKAVAAWSDLGRPGRPILWGMGYFALGDGNADTGAEYLRHYYAFTGPFAEKIAAGNLTSPGAITDFIRGYEDAGCDELVLFPTASSIEQVDRLAEVIG